MMTNLVGPIAAGLLAFNQVPLPDPAFASVLLALDFDTPQDLSSNAQPITLRSGNGGGSAIPDSSKRRFGTQSAYFTTNVNGIRAPAASASALNDLGTGDWTIEMWAARNSEPTSTSYLYGCWRSLSNFRHLRIGYNPGTNQFTVEVSTTGADTITASFDLDTDGVTLATAFDGNFHHIVAQRTGANLDIYVDGIRGSVRGNLGTNPVFYPTGARNTPVNIGSMTGVNDGAQPDNGWSLGWIDEFRITKGLARYSGTSFSVPTTRFGRSVGDDPDFGLVTLLLDFEGAWGPQYFGNQTGVTASQIYGGSNDEDFYRDGVAVTTATTGLVNFADSASPDWGLGGGDFCIEVFGVLGSFTSPRTIVGNYGAVNGQRGWAITGGGVANSFQLLYSVDGINQLTVSCGDLTSTFIGASSLDSATRYDLCIERQGTNLRFFVNGILVRTVAFTDTIFNPGAANVNLSVLAMVNGAGSRSNGWSTELRAVRVTRAARYGGADYTVPTLPLPKS